MKRKKIAFLNQWENAEWESHFIHAVQELKYGNTRAGQYAWRNVQRIFPRLRAFDGASAQTKFIKCQRCGSENLQSFGNGNFRCVPCGEMGTVIL